MKHTELEDHLAGYLGQMDVGLTQAQLSLLTRHISLVLEANRRVNLTRITNPQDAAKLHTADSLSVLEDVARGPEGTLVDIGSGAGYPGIPLAICSDREVLLVDSVGKKVRELAHMVDELGISDRVHVRAGRAEALGRSDSGRFAVVTARAVSELPALVELAAPLLVREGRLVCLKGSPEEAEVRRANQVAALVGLRLEYERTLDLPEGAGHRTVFCYRKTAESSVPLPRREGLAQHSPLA